MKTPSLASLSAVAAVLGCTRIAAGDDTDVICTNDLSPGQPCKNAKGQDSRCSHFSVCIDDFKECLSSAKLLESCSTIYTNYCFPMFDGKPMQCLSLVDIETIVQRDACIGKNDGTPCKNAYAESNGRAGLTATVYEQEGVCEDSYCLPTRFATCSNDKIGAACSINAVDNGNLVRFNGVCKSEEPYRPWCTTSGKGAVIRPATVITGSNSAVSTPPSSPSSKTPAPSSAVVKKGLNVTSTTGVRHRSGQTSRTMLLTRSSCFLVVQSLVSDLNAAIDDFFNISTSSPSLTPQPTASSGCRNSLLERVVMIAAALLFASL